MMSASLKDLGLRALSSVVMAAIALTLTWWGGWSFALLWLVAGIAIFYEACAIARVKAPPYLMHGITLCIAFAASFPYWSILPDIKLLQTGFLVTGALAALALCETGRDKAWALAAYGYALVVVFVPPWVRMDAQFGLMAMLWIYAVVWLTDIFAYFTGRLIGGPKLWPAISPKKTWSGFIGGVTCGAIGGTLVYAYFMSTSRHDPQDFILVGIASLLAAMVGQGGDLLESAFKRHFDVKDASHIIPGHGGVMDRLDAFWAVCVIVMIALLIKPYLA
jgi:phosphatidate cytidylyltransferase